MNSFAELWNSLDLAAILAALVRVVGVLLCLTVHETCHGLAAFVLGDPTAKRAHRLSFNPLHHIDWFGFASMLLLGFGWAKPVPIDMTYFKKPKQGMAITALAGPASNLLLAVLLLFGAKCIDRYVPFAMGWYYVYYFCLRTAALSVGLAVFNLIPIPPLDGSKVVAAVLPDRAYLRLMRYEQYGMAALLLLVWLGVGDNLLGRVIAAVYQFLINLIF